MSKEIKFNERMYNSRDLSFQLFLNSYEKYDPEKIGFTIFENRIKKPLEKMFKDKCDFSKIIVSDAYHSSVDSNLHKSYHFSIFKKGDEQNDDTVIAIPYMYLNFESIKYNLDGIYIADVENLYLGKTKHYERNEIGILVDSLFPIVDYKQNAGGGSSNHYRILFKRSRDDFHNVSLNKSAPFDLYLAYDEILEDYIYLDEELKSSINKKIDTVENLLHYKFYKIIIERVLRLK